MNSAYADQTASDIVGFFSFSRFFYFTLFTAISLFYVTHPHHFSIVFASFHRIATDSLVSHHTFRFLLLSEFRFLPNDCWFVMYCVCIHHNADVDCSDTSRYCTNVRSMGLCRLHRYQQKCCHSCRPPHQHLVSHRNRRKND